jgi:hypothetical protein
VRTSLPVDPVIAPAAPSYRDRSALLVVLGVVQIVMGLFTLLLVPFVLLTVFMARKSPMGAMPPGYYVLSIASYTLVAAVMIGLGVGSVKARRWGRDLTLVASWLWLAYGAVTLVMITVVLPSSMLAGFKAASASNPQATALPAGLAAVIATLIIAFFAVFMVVLPIIFVVFYAREDVKATCRRRDPTPRWTERLPLPVLAASVIFAIGALYYLLLSFTMPLVPFFGRYLTGLPAGTACLALAALDVVLAVLLFRRLAMGWWIAVAAVLLRAAAIAFTFRRANLLEAYSRMGWSSQQLHLMEANPMYRSGGFLWFGVAFLVIFLGYLLWIRRYFTAPPAEEMLPPALPQ